MKTFKKTILAVLCALCLTLGTALAAACGNTSGPYGVSVQVKVDGTVATELEGILEVQVTDEYGNEKAEFESGETAGVLLAGFDDIHYEVASVTANGLTVNLNDYGVYSFEITKDTAVVVNLNTLTGEPCSVDVEVYVDEVLTTDLEDIVEVQVSGEMYAEKTEFNSGDVVWVTLAGLNDEEYAVDSVTANGTPLNLNDDYGVYPFAITQNTTVVVNISSLTEDDYVNLKLFTAFAGTYTEGSDTLVVAEDGSVTLNGEPVKTLPYDEKTDLSFAVKYNGGTATLFVEYDNVLQVNLATGSGIDVADAETDGGDDVKTFTRACTSGYEAYQGYWVGGTSEIGELRITDKYVVEATYSSSDSSKLTGVTYYELEANVESDGYTYSNYEVKTYSVGSYVLLYVTATQEEADSVSAYCLNQNVQYNVTVQEAHAGYYKYMPEAEEEADIGFLEFGVDANGVDLVLNRVSITADEGAVELTLINYDASSTTYIGWSKGALYTLVWSEGQVTVNGVVYSSEEAIAAQLPEWAWGLTWTDAEYTVEVTEDGKLKWGGEATTGLVNIYDNQFTFVDCNSKTWYIDFNENYTVHLFDGDDVDVVLNPVVTDSKIHTDLLGTKWAGNNSEGAGEEHTVEIDLLGNFYYDGVKYELTGSSWENSQEGSIGGNYTFQYNDTTYYLDISIDQWMTSFTVKDGAGYNYDKVYVSFSRVVEGETSFPAELVGKTLTSTDAGTITFNSDGTITWNNGGTVVTLYFDSYNASLSLYIFTASNGQTGNFQWNNDGDGLAFWVNETMKSYEFFLPEA